MSSIKLRLQQITLLLFDEILQKDNFLKVNISLFLDIELLYVHNFGFNKQF